MESGNYLSETQTLIDLYTCGKIVLMQINKYQISNNWKGIGLQTYLQTYHFTNPNILISGILSACILACAFYSLNKKEWICSLFKEWILEKSEIRVNLEWTFVLFTHFGVTSGITRNPWVIPVVTPKWVNNTNVHNNVFKDCIFLSIKGDSQMDIRKSN